ncbi:TRAP transporter small permease subunit [bacterium]|nr:TRAP transporter small permease subunit [bacterium]
MFQMINRIELVEKVVLTLLILGSVLMSLAGVFFRYVLNDSLAFVEEIAGYILITVVVVGSSLAIRSRDHIRVELLPQILPSTRRWANLLAWLTVLAVSIVMCWLSARFAMRLLAQNQTSYSIVGLKVGYPMLALPVGYALGSFKAALVLFDEIAGRQVFCAPSVADEELREVQAPEAAR